MVKEKNESGFIAALADAKQSYIDDGVLPPLTLWQWLEIWARNYHQHTALVDGDEYLSYQGLKESAEYVAAGLQQQGIGAGDTVLVQLPNSNHFVVLCFALFRLGAKPIMAMPAHREKDINALCQQAQPVAYVVPDHFLGFNYQVLADHISQQHPCIRTVIIDGKSANHLTFEQFLHSAPLDPDTLQPSPTNIALLLLSGGTTGTPKLIPRTHADYAFNAIESAKVCKMSPQSVYLAALPISHNFPLACPGILGTLSVGGKVVMAKTAGDDEAFSLIEQEKVTITALVPPLAKLWLETKEWDETDISSLQLLQIGGSRLEEKVARQIKPILGCQLQQVFGMAEGLLCYTRLDDDIETVATTQGKPLSTADQIQILAPDGSPVSPGEAGELLTKGPYTIKGYYLAEEHNKKAFTQEGFYQSGDLVRQTANGYLIVEGRLKEQINRAGEKIAIAEIEELLVEHPDVIDCILIPVPDERLGERSCAFVISDNPAFDLQQVQQYLTQHGLPRYKQPDQLEHIAMWPLTTVSKVNKQALSQLAIEND
ncbi:(2,3-dihydroxybenzoyl)adenylate synthase [Photobacterium sanguinicancri]|uniref:(2,3-dihydroxybenzoyl)adenylate synthase n=1 Tax=Photobacterium sanguinicancri TaxID=875932 RepID=UPI0026E30973|nr:AMP-binding protein [Photobacterium sanguinicancri]MDO6496570.1 AMP-binding protein [Photobacterium sanguinicancri]